MAKSAALKRWEKQQKGLGPAKPVMIRGDFGTTGEVYSADKAGMALFEKDHLARVKTKKITKIAKAKKDKSWLE